jgi:shikimate kinase
MNERHLVLVGLMGAGKTTVGRRCAKRLDRPFVDTDELVVALAAMPIDEIWRTGGEARFRELEHQAVVDVCASPEPLVIACGGGTVVDADNRRRLGDAGMVVWLRAPTSVLAQRVGTGARRPLLAGDPEGALVRLAASREDAYAASAELIVDTDELGLDQVADTVVAAFEAGP